MADLPLKPAKQTVESGKLWKALDDLVPVKDKNQQVESSDTFDIDTTWTKKRPHPHLQGSAAVAKFQ